MDVMIPPLNSRGEGNARQHTADEALTLVAGCLEEEVFGSKMRLVEVEKIWL